AGYVQRASACRRSRLPSSRASRRPGEQVSRRIVWGHEATGADRPRACERPQGAADGRAFRRARCSDPGTYAERARGDLAQDGQNDRVHYPRYHRGSPAGGSHRRHDQGAGVAPPCNWSSRPAAAPPAPAQQSRLRRDVGAHQRADRERRGEWTMTEVSPVRDARPADAVTSAPRLPLGGIKRDHLIYIASIIGLIMLWHLIATTFFKPQFFPPPLLVLSTGREMLESGELMEHISISLQRILAGFLIGSAIAAPAGLLMGSIPIVRAIFDPYVQFFRFVPSLAWLTPVVIWFGIGETSKVLIIVYTTIFIVLINTMVGVSHIAPNK